MEMHPCIRERPRQRFVGAPLTPVIVPILGIFLAVTDVSAQEVLRIYTGVGEETDSFPPSCEERREALVLGDQERVLNDAPGTARQALWIVAADDALADEVSSDDPYFLSDVAFTLCSAVDLTTGATVDFWQQGMVLEGGEVWAVCSVGNLCRAGSLAFVALRELADGTNVAASALDDITALASCMVQVGGNQ